MNGIAKITIDGQEVVLKFGLPAIRRIMEKMLQYTLVDTEGEKGAEAYTETYNDLGLSHILYAGYLNGCIMKDIPADLKFEAFYMLLENCAENKDGAAQVIAAIACFEESKIVKQSIEKLKEEVEKKSPLIGMTSNPSLSENLELHQLNIAGSPGGSTY